MKKLGKRKVMLIIYFIVILISLVVIMFILPDSFFRKQYEDINISKEIEKKDFIDYEIQIEHILKKKFTYEYNLLDSMGTQSYTFECSGTINETIESGTCIIPEKVSYTEKEKAEVFKNIDVNYLDVDYIFNLIKNVEPEKTEYQTLREYNYKIKIKDLDTDITVHTDLNEITKIYISNAYMTYILKYTNVSY